MNDKEMVETMMILMRLKIGDSFVFTEKGEHYKFKRVE